MFFKNYVEELKLEGKKGEAVFSGLILNENGKLEFKKSNLFANSGITFIFEENLNSLVINKLDKDVRIKLSKENVEKIMNFRAEIMKDLNDLYVNIVSGKEKLICFPTELEKYPYHITTETILDKGMYSPKYIQALIYACSDKCLKRFNIGKYPNFKDYGDLQKRLAEAIINLNLKSSNYKNSEAVLTTLELLLKGVKQ